ncbi:hypothetical protein H310_02924 [Aphanomyces invadans]|uniref:MYND-type domain-containing protein n=1 Tax=Aphanomyces invadans TaxID=157072 RepID=A0A024UKP7_9STRA|nr:hypothetical protein H310_02924 [Aphanomyces invadans]ETW06765.1 hypothetical protein H310_02924 [Aphanomyces invadans]|eukprot:XP_008864840.1 hypothetical protein H310_02924 [Aphanomyces invadans]
MSTPSASYDEICEKGKEEAEQRLIDHFKDNGGEVWNIRSGCMGCKTNPNNVPLKTCSQCKTALFCSKDCQKTAWKTHKHECLVISTMSHNEADNAEISSIITSCLETFSWSHDIKTTSDPLLTKVAKSIGLDGPSYPGWFCTVNLVNHPAAQSAYIQAIVKLYSLLRDEACWTRDSDSFPRSSYTFATTIQKTSTWRSPALAAFVAANGPLVIFSAWLQDPQPPAIQSVPFEKRMIYGLLDSLLQIEEVRLAIDDYMDNLHGEK